MTIRNTILANLSDPNRAYVILLGGMLLVFREFLHPGRVLPGLVGALCASGAVYGLSQAGCTWYGLSLIVLAIGLVGAQFRSESNLLAALSAVVFPVGSWLLVTPPRQISWPAALLGLPFILVANYLVRAAGRARRSKRQID